MSHEDSITPQWQIGELSPDEAAQARERLQGIPTFQRALGEFARSLGSDESRAYLYLPIMQGARPGDIVGAMAGAASNFPQTVDQLGVADMPPQVLGVDEFDMPPGTRERPGFMVDAPIGYVKVQHTEAGMAYTVGALDPTTNTAFSLNPFAMG